MLSTKLIVLSRLLKWSYHVKTLQGKHSERDGTQWPKTLPSELGETLQYLDHVHNLHYNICHHTYCLQGSSFGKMWHCFTGWVVPTKLSQSRRWEYSATLLWEPQFWYCCLWFIHSRLNTTITALPDTEFGFVRDINGPLSTCKYYMNNSTVGLYGRYFKIFFEQMRHVWFSVF